ncbi:MAG TPA: ROK family transcriptional regulator [Firmicutes bacterium]|nr:ROK family transcriptional regulator [Bacillota bacterium]
MFKKAINQELMRTNNKAQILRCVKAKHVVSKRELTEELGLSTTTVATFIRELEEENLILNSGIARSTGGRRSLLYQLNPDYCYTLGLDLQVDRIVGVLLDFKGDVQAEKEVAFQGRDEWQVVPLLKTFIHDLLATHKIPWAKLGGIGIGVPGVLNNEAEIIDFAPNLGWKNVDLPAMLALDKPVYLENEANAGALGEVEFGLGRNVGHLAYISVGMGIGCGLIIDHRLFSGHLRNAGEFGHMTVEPEGLPCRCGNRGCWEVYASNAAALRMYAEETGNQQITFPEFLLKCHEDDHCATNVLQTVSKYLGLGIASVINGLNPEMVIIGGEIANVKPLIFNSLLKEIKERTLEKSYAGVRLEFSQLGNKAAALGMGTIVLEQIINALT